MANTDKWNFTRIVATLGPATADERVLRAILDAGVDVCRLNFSHGTLDEHAAQLAGVRAWMCDTGRPVAVLGDLCGPKIRLTEVAGGAFEVATGTTVCLGAGNAPSTPDCLHVDYPALVDEVCEGHRVYIDDGAIRMLVTERRAGRAGGRSAGGGDELVCACLAGGVVRSRKGVNLPDSRLSTPPLTDKDLRDLAWAVEQELDYVALSFARRPEDLDGLRRRLASRSGRQGVIVKIEKREALEHVDYFVRHADGIMVARGDLGVEMDVWRVPLIQKQITHACRAAGKPVIIATQMLQSMIESPGPTRAEVSDVANAILDEVDAVMLSAETAVGRHPARAVEIMRLTGQAAEAHRAGLPRREIDGEAARDARTAAVASAAVRAALHLRARLVAAWTSSGETVRLVARHRLPMPVVGLTYHEHVWRQLALLHGVIPIKAPPISHPGEMARVLDEELLAHGLVTRGDIVVVVASTRPTRSGNTDTTLVHRVGDGVGEQG